MALDPHPALTQYWGGCRALVRHWSLTMPKRRPKVSVDRATSTILETCCPGLGGV
jgi:hypothetical protein